jgi:alpha-tubulin suppressor-like RCC1 family protein
MTGDGTAARTTPVDVIGDVTQMSRRCALVNTAVLCWGSNQYGQVGDGTTTDPTSPVAVQGLGGPVTQVSSGGGNACALMADTTVQCWGRGAQYGGAGPGTPLPSLVSGLSGVTQISSGGSNTCALLADSTVKCWGINTDGQVGDGTTTTQLTPTTVVGLTGVAQISAGGSHTCARLTDGTVKCWGNNTYGQLGNGNNARALTPILVSEITTATQISVGQSTCAVLADQSARC